MTAQKNKDRRSFPEENQILVLDTNIFLLGIDFNVIKGELYTVPGILDEIRVERYREKNRNILIRIEFALNSNKLALRRPEKEYIEIVKVKAKKTGDLKALSQTDLELIALTLELDITTNKDAILYTNDYSMENVCSELNIEFSPLGKKGIQKKIHYEVYCPYCQEVHDPEDLGQKCEKCGSKLKRRPKR
ncbi:MAG: hypothetical protein GF311_14235 [Candidatus Lokiarchaeota archaeon]|nr:hypothetical protein [Candidatus Lokiarchaeota archaeon]